MMHYEKTCVSPFVTVHAFSIDFSGIPGFSGNGAFDFLKVPRVTREILDHKDRLDQKEIKAIPEPLVQLDHKDHREFKVRKAIKVIGEIWVQLVLQVHKAFKDQLVLKDLLDLSKPLT